MVYMFGLSVVNAWPLDFVVAKAGVVDAAIGAP